MKCKNSNIEYRNSKQYQNSNFQNSKLSQTWSKQVWTFRFLSFEFVSDFAHSTSSGRPEREPKDGFRASNLILFAICLFAYLLISPSASALTMSNDRWVIQMGNLNMAAGNLTGDNYKVGFTAGQTAPGLYSGTNYKVRAGFQYIHSIIPFRFVLSETLVDFGSLSATNPVTRTHSITISNGSAFGYSVTAYENHQLLSPPSGALIPDTTCDDGTCTQTTSAAWSNILTYGFGYRCDNEIRTDCASGFSDSTYYKQFADDSASETSVSVMSSVNATSSAKVRITYKANISATQPAGFYTNTITYIATPTF